MKVYLGKSNRSNPNLVQDFRVRLLTKFNIEEYTGGAYSFTPLEKANAAVIILENNILGKGVFEQIMICKQQNKKGYVIIPYKDKIYIADFKNVALQKIGDNDYISWGKLTWNNSVFSIDDKGGNNSVTFSILATKVINLLHNDLECYNITKSVDEIANITKDEKKLTNQFVNADGEFIDIESINENSEKKFQEFKRQCLLLLPRLM